MDSWEWNKIAGAVLGTVLFVLVVNFVAQAVYDSPLPKRAGYVVEPPDGAEIQAPPKPEPVPDFATVLPAADAAHGKEVLGRCQQCHEAGKGGRNKSGPSLWGIVNRPRASVPGYAYSNAMAANHDPWTYDRLYVFLRAPSIDVPANKMSFVGVRSVQDRLDLIAYLRTLSDDPAPLPAKK